MFTIAVAGAMMLIGDAAFRHGISIKDFDPGQLAMALGAQYGPFVKTSILLLMINASVLGTMAISLSSAWAYGEVRGWPHSLHKSVKEAPGFYGGLSPACVVAAAALRAHSQGCRWR